MATHEIYLACKAWTERKSWRNLKALWGTFAPRVNAFQRTYYIIKNTITKKYERVCAIYEAREFRGD